MVSAERARLKAEAPQRARELIGNLALETLQPLAAVRAIDTLLDQLADDNANLYLVKELARLRDEFVRTIVPRALADGQSFEVVAGLLSYQQKVA